MPGKERKKVLAVGGGNTTVKAVTLAKSTASDVVWIHRRDSMRAYPKMVKRLEKEGTKILYNTELKEIKGTNRVERAVLVNNKTGKRDELAVDWIVICVGTEPNTELARKANIKIKGKYVEVNGNLMTNKEGIFACGEITGCERHVITSASSGASAGMAVSEYLALEKIRRGEIFEGAINGKYAEDYLEMLKKER